MMSIFVVELRAYKNSGNSPRWRKSKSSCFGMRLFSTVAFDVLGTCLVKAAIMWALRYRPAFPVYVDERAI
jgi:hypothetical protein